MFYNLACSHCLINPVYSPASTSPFHIWHDYTNLHINVTLFSPFVYLNQDPNKVHTLGLVGAHPKSLLIYRYPSVSLFSLHTLLSVYFLQEPVFAFVEIFAIVSLLTTSPYFSSLYFLLISNEPRSMIRSRFNVILKCTLLALYI